VVALDARAGTVALRFEGWGDVVDTPLGRVEPLSGGAFARGACPPPASPPPVREMATALAPLAPLEELQVRLSGTFSRDLWPRAGASEQLPGRESPTYADYGDVSAEERTSHRSLGLRQGAPGF